MTNAVFLPVVLEFNRPAVEARIEALAAYLGIPGGFDGFLEALLDFREKLGVPPTLVALGVENPDIDTLAAEAAEDPSCGGNPVPVDAGTLADLYKKAM